MKTLNRVVMGVTTVFALVFPFFVLPWLPALFLGVTFAVAMNVFAAVQGRGHRRYLARKRGESSQ